MIKTNFGSELKSKLLSGINKLNDAVSSTLGPSGRTVIISDESGVITTTKDGVSVGKSFTKLEDPVEDIGAQMVKQVSINAADKAGDGTTTSTLLATVMIQEGFKSINDGSNAVEVKKGMDLSVQAVVEQLKVISEDINKQKQILQVATLSGNNDEKVGKLIATALEKVGENGIVAIEQSKTGETLLEIVEGMMFDRGYKSPYFITDQSQAQAVLDNPLVLTYDGRINSAKQIVEILQYINAQDRSLLIVAEDIDSEALAILVANVSRGTVKVCAVKAPDFGTRRSQILEDISVLVGSKLISPAKGESLEKIDKTKLSEIFGNARMATITSSDTTIIDGRGSKESYETRLNAIKAQIDISKSAFEKEKLQDRLGKLAGGVAIIHVGGLSEIEMKEKKDRVEDALHATKAALAQGIVPGGGIALINCEDALDGLELANRDQELGREIIRKALYAPFIKILHNAGVENYFEILTKIKSSASKTKQKWQGYNVKTGQYGNLKDIGVIDPTKVTRTAIENAVSVAGTIITTQSVVYAIPEAKIATPNYEEMM